MNKVQKSSRKRMENRVRNRSKDKPSFLTLPNGTPVVVKNRAGRKMLARSNSRSK